jgi:hypothetical protein
LLQVAASLATTALADIGAAVGYASGTGLDLSSLQSTLAAPGATTRGTEAYAAAQSSLADTRSSIGTAIGGADATLTSAAVSQAGSPQAGAAGLLAATDAAGQASSLYSARSFFDRAAVNLANAST